MIDATPFRRQVRRHAEKVEVLTTVERTAAARLRKSFTSVLTETDGVNSIAENDYADFELIGDA